jgi:hypothetical protein
MQIKVVCSWCDKFLGYKKCSWADGQTSHGICETCFEREILGIEGASIETEQEWADTCKGEDETSYTQNDGECAMGAIE